MASTTEKPVLFDLVHPTSATVVPDASMLLYEAMTRHTRRQSVNDSAGASDADDARAQSWYWTAHWQETEREADEDLAAGRSQRFESGEDFLSALRDLAAE
jgi:hypothetical protein